jgi:hypothetical protein
LRQRGASFAAVAAEPAPEWRIIAPDRRGHGESDRAAGYSREGCLAELPADHFVYVGDPVAVAGVVREFLHSLDASG